MSIPWFTLFFTLFILLGAIFSTESLLVWIVTIVFIYRILKYCNNIYKTSMAKLKYCIINTLVPLLIIFLLNKAFDIGTKMLLG